jgi:hypothetical protein
MVSAGLFMRFFPGLITAILTLAACSTNGAEAMSGDTAGWIHLQATAESVTEAFGTPVAVRHAGLEGGKPMELQDFQNGEDGFEFQMQDGRALKARAATLIFSEGVLTRIIINPNNPAGAKGAAGSLQRGVPGKVTAIRQAE